MRRFSRITFNGSRQTGISQDDRPITNWLNNLTIEGASVFVAENALFTAYNQLYGGAGWPPEIDTGFGQTLAQLRVNLKEGQRI